MQTLDHIALPGATVALFLILAPAIGIASTPVPAETISPALLAKVVAHHAVHLVTIDSDASAMALFTTTVGPSLGLKDAAGTLGAKGLPAKVAKELGVAELSQSVYQLMAALAAWQSADAVINESEPVPSPPTTQATIARQDWLQATSQLSTLADFFRILREQPSPNPQQPAPQMQRTELLLAAHRVAFEAHQHAAAAWWELHEWKERIRRARGQARLCGTWQWIIHNHQNHREQKTVMLFPPAGQAPANFPLPAETAVFGDSIYLRWEQDGHIQEDSLLFIKDGTMIEGSFVNNAGGWGSITGKRTSSCQP
ncbi:MAG: hypothetical protein ACT4OL_07765 [Nitrospiraceae bacterium]